MILLAIGSVLAGFIPFGNFVSSDGQPLHPHLDMMVASISVVVAVTGIAIAWLFYKNPSALPDKLSESLGALYRAALKKFYIDELYLFITKKIIFNFISRPIAWFDRHVIDAFMDLTATFTNRVSREIKNLQSGQLQHYAYIFITGVVLIVLVILYTNA
jgi:NADH-quinone oxidoreductase subunit L